jgi:hypothetical protein
LHPLAIDTMVVGLPCDGRHSRATAPEVATTDRRAGPLHHLRLRPPSNSGSMPGVRNNPNHSPDHLKKAEHDDLRSYLRPIESSGGFMIRPIGIAFMVLLLAAECVAWRKSYATEYSADRQIGSEVYSGGSLLGQIYFGGTTRTPPQTPRYRGWEFDATPCRGFVTLPPNKVCLLGFGWEDRTFTFRSWYKPQHGPPTVSAIQWSSVLIPWWAVCLVTAAMLARQLRRLRRPFREAGHCVTCGYDLRATPDRCPECGTVTSKPDTNPAPSNATNFGHPCVLLNPTETS